MPEVTIDAYADFACPWCYVGKRRLDNALKQLSCLTVHVRWHPYMIDPGTKKAGEEYMAYNRRRWGGDGWTHSMRSGAKADGIAFADWKWWPNTLNAHRLMVLAQKEGKAHELKERLLVRLYEHGENISDRDVVIRIGEEAGLPGVREFMGSDAGLKEVVEEDRKAKGMDVDGVPYFLINGKVDASGAQPTAWWVRTLQKLAK
eukprot:RCo039251